MNNVIQLETDDEIVASDGLSAIVESAFLGRHSCQDYLKKLWNENWLSIKEKLQTEGSVWYVWWMDGVRQHLENIR